MLGLDIQPTLTPATATSNAAAIGDLPSGHHMEVEKLPAAISLDLPLQQAAAAFYKLDLEASALTVAAQDPPPPSGLMSDHPEAMEDLPAEQPPQQTPTEPGPCQSTVAAVRVQKMYRSYRTRRRLADSVVIAEELWWQALDFARLNHSTISFFDYSKPESPHSKWGRIKDNASKVGKGLAEDGKALKLAFQHWIEAIDPRHRYGHNLHYYYEEWCKSDAGQPFFYWLDIGGGKNVDLEQCPRSRLREQVVAYLGPKEREAFEYEVVDGLVVKKLTGEPLDTTSGSQKGKWIFVMSTSRQLYAGLKRKGFFHHSSFLAGGATIAAGRLKAEGGVLKTISAYSGHYKPTEENLNNLLLCLTEFGVDRNAVEIEFSSNEDYYDDSNSKSKNGRSTSPDRPEQPKPDQGEETATEAAAEPETDPSGPTTRTTLPRPPQLQLDTLQLNLPVLQPPYIPSVGMPTQDEDNQLLPPQPTPGTPTRVYRRTLSGGLQSPRADVPRKAILQRIESKKKSMSYQLGHQLSSKWTTGAGPRIGCVADYPIEVRKQALEFVNLSPRAAAVPTPGSVNRFSPQFFSPRLHGQSSLPLPLLSRLGSAEGAESASQLSRLGSVEGIEC